MSQHTAVPPIIDKPKKNKEKKELLPREKPEKLLKRYTATAKIGRPTLYNLDKMIPIMINGFAEGKAVCEICRDMGISKNAYYEYRKRHKEFDDAHKYGIGLSEAWWCEMAKKNLESRHFQTGLWYANMKNRFGWVEKAEIKHEGMNQKIMINIAQGVNVDNGNRLNSVNSNGQ